MRIDSYDVVAVGTGFATSFFLHRYLSRIQKPIRVLVLEAGERVPHDKQIAMRGSSSMPNSRENVTRQFVNRTPEKSWTFYTAFGGGSNCWWACTPRLLPEDFRLRSIHGVGMDWPLTYEDLEPYYCDAEDLMQISGDSVNSPYPRSRPYPQNPHQLTEPARLLGAAFPGKVFSHPVGRSTGPVNDQRGACCNNGVCNLCPINAKFTILNGMKKVYEDSRVEVIVGARVERLMTQNGVVGGLQFRKDGVERKIAGDLFVLGANALFNPHILLRSGIDHPELGRGLCEQVSRSVYIDLKGIENYKTGSISSALGYMFYGGISRKDKAAALIQTDDRLVLRNERGKWLQRMRLNFVYEDYRLPDNRVELSSDDPTRPVVTHRRRSEQTDRGLDSMDQDLQGILEALPNEGYEIEPPWRTDSHIMGTTVMGNDPVTSIADSFGLHHRYRNLMVLGSGLFPTAAPPNPTLTLSALALRSADHIVGA